jgi:hypothetical protein
MKRLAIVVLAIVVLLGAFWIGLMLNFPGEAVSRYVERQVNRHQGFDLLLAPAELRWNRLVVERAELRRRDNPAAEPLFVVTDFAVPVTWRLIRGLPVRGVLGKEGEVRAFLPWALGGEARLDATVYLETVPPPAVVKPIALTGKVELQGRFIMDAEAQVGTRLPDGTLELTGQGVIVSGIKAGGVDLPPTRLDALAVTLETGRTINVRRFEFRGDLQGTVAGTLTPNLREPRNSLLALRIVSAFKDGWLTQLGTLRPLLESFLERGRIVLSLGGTVGRPLLQPVRGAN